MGTLRVPRRSRLRGLSSPLRCVRSALVTSPGAFSRPRCARQGPKSGNHRGTKGELRPPFSGPPGASSSERFRTFHGPGNQRGTLPTWRSAAAPEPVEDPGTGQPPGNHRTTGNGPGGVSAGNPGPRSHYRQVPLPATWDLPSRLSRAARPVLYIENSSPMAITPSSPRQQAHAQYLHKLQPRCDALEMPRSAALSDLRSGPLPSIGYLTRGFGLATVIRPVPRARPSLRVDGD